jgi:selenide,water dikinase
VRDAEPKYGLAVTGVVEPDKVVRNSTAKSGDALILTKPLGSGIIATAIKAGLASRKTIEKVTDLMAELNKTASEVMVALGADACTDVTGFGLMGHLQEMVASSGVSARIYASSIPIMDEVWELLEKDCVPGGSKANKKYADKCALWHHDVAEPTRMALCDAQTSGGLLLAVESAEADRMLASLHEAGIHAAAVIGKIEEGDASCIYVDP